MVGKTVDEIEIGLTPTRDLDALEQACLGEWVIGDKALRFLTIFSIQNIYAAACRRAEVVEFGAASE